MGKLVLVVDDDDDVCSAVAELLRLEGYGVQTAHHGQEGLQAVARQLPDLILLDMKMPIMGGTEFATAFRARYGREVPIVVFTAADDAQRRAARNRRRRLAGQALREQPVVRNRGAEAALARRSRL